jgi:hypothetical protein
MKERGICRPEVKTFDDMVHLEKYEYNKYIKKREEEVSESRVWIKALQKMI